MPCHHFCLGRFWIFSNYHFLVSSVIIHSHVYQRIIHNNFKFIIESHLTLLQTVLSPHQTFMGFWSVWLVCSTPISSGPYWLVAFFGEQGTWTQSDTSHYILTRYLTLLYHFFISSLLLQCRRLENIIMIAWNQLRMFGVHLCACTRANTLSGILQKNFSSEGQASIILESTFAFLLHFPSWQSSV